MLLDKEDFGCTLSLYALSFFFLGLHPWHVEVLKLEVKLEL